MSGHRLRMVTGLDTVAFALIAPSLLLVRLDFGRVLAVLVHADAGTNRISDCRTDEFLNVVQAFDFAKGDEF